MKAAGSIDNHYIHIIGLGRLERIESHSGRVGAQFLLHYRHSGTFTPHIELLHGGGTEGIGGAKHHLIAGSLELRSEFADGGGFAHTVHTHHHNHVGMMTLGHSEILVGRFVGVFGKKSAYLIAEQTVKLRRIHILVVRHTFLQAFDNLKRGVYAHIGGDENFLQVVEHLIVDFRLACHGTGNFLKQTLLGAVEAFIECFLFFFGKNSAEKICHNSNPVEKIFTYALNQLN